MNLGRSPSRNLTLKNLHDLMAAASHAFCIDRRLNTFVTVHFGAAGRSRRYKTDQDARKALVKLMQDWLRTKTKEPPYYVWVLERDQYSGLHLHLVIHVPYQLQKAFKKAESRWLHQVGNNPGLGSFDVRPVRNSAKGCSTWDYLGYWGGVYGRDGLKGLLGYVLKGLEQQQCRALGIQYAAQGVVAGKRCGFSEALGPARRKTVSNAWRTPHPRFPQITLRSQELLRRRFLHHAGLLSETNYDAT